jgi:large subunit ribosomal protein L4
MSEQVEIKSKGGSVKVPAAIFGAEVKNNLLHQSVRWLRAKKRSGSHTVLTRTQVRGGGAKPWRQKGTGRARAGSSSSPLWVGGGVAHGPKKKSYEFDLNKKEKKSALCGALSARRAEEKVLVIKDLKLKEIKTSAAVKALADAGLPADKKAVVVINGSDQVVSKSLRNIGNVKLATSDSLTVYDVLGAPWLVLVGDALDKIVARLDGSAAAEKKAAE